MVDLNIEDIERMLPANGRVLINRKGGRTVSIEVLRENIYVMTLPALLEVLQKVNGVNN